MASVNGTQMGNATTSGDGTPVLRYDVPHYRMRSLGRRLDALSSACSDRGIELGYDIWGSVQRQHVEMLDGDGRRRRFTNAFDAPLFLMDHVVLRDGVRGEEFRVAAVIDRHAEQVRPLSCDDEMGRVLADEWWYQEMEAKPKRYEKYLSGEPGQEILERLESASVTNVDGFSGQHGMTEGLVTSPATCSACGKTAKNGMTYLVMDESSEALLQVGGCCISKYANGLPARYVTRYAEVLSQMALHSSPAGLITLPSAAEAVQARVIVAAALRIIDQGGYSMWKTSGTSCTWWEAMWVAKNGSNAEGQILPEGVGKRLDEAEQAIEWARQGFPGLPPGKWLDSIAAAVSETREGYVECRIADSIAPIALLWHRNQAYRRIRAHSEWIAPSGSEWAGDPGDRLRKRIVRIENMARTQVDSPVGLQARDLNALLTDEGNVLIWRTTLDLSDIITKISPDSPVLLDATILRKQEYLGMKETVVTRGKLRWPDGRKVAAGSIRR